MKLPLQSRAIRNNRIVSIKDTSISGLSSLNLKLLGGNGGGSTPPFGCWPSGTECRGFIQHMVYCCPGGTTWKKKQGWCIGWWDAPPCI
jgi:hypothetical protein